MNGISDDLVTTGKADSRLTAEYTGGRGCGGISILWHKSIGAVPVDGIKSDCLCAVRFSINVGVPSIMTVIGVYLPCSDQSLDCYKNHLIELGNILNESLALGQVMVLGDFNAHLGALGGLRGRGVANAQGLLISELMSRYSLIAVSLGSLATGPQYTYVSGNVCSTVDYVFADAGAVSLMSTCHIAEMEDLNTSDHVPITVEMSYDPLPPVCTSFSVSPKFDWALAMSNGFLRNYQDAVLKCLSKVPEISYQCINDINAEILHVSQELQNAAYDTLPIVCSSRPQRYKDNTLSVLCSQSRAARK